MNHAIGERAKASSRVNRIVDSIDRTLDAWTDPPGQDAADPSNQDLATLLSQMQDRIHVGMLFNNVIAKRRIHSYFTTAASQVLPPRDIPDKDLYDHLEYIVPGMEEPEDPTFEAITQYVKARRSLATVFRKITSENRDVISRLLADDR